LEQADWQMADDRMFCIQCRHQLRGLPLFTVVSLTQFYGVLFYVFNLYLSHSCNDKKPLKVSSILHPSIKKNLNQFCRINSSRKANPERRRIMHFSGFLTAWLLCLRFHGADAFMSPLHPSIYGKILGKPASPDTVDAVMNAKDAFSKTKHNFMGDFNVDLPKVSLPDAHGFGESFTLALNTMPNVGPNMDLIKKSILSGIADFPEDLSDFGYMIVDTLNLEEYGGWYVAAISIALSLGQRRARLEEAQERFAAMLREADQMAAEAAEAATVAVEEAKLAKVVTVCGCCGLRFVDSCGFFSKRWHLTHFLLSHDRKGCTRQC
jgi:hypothetical protein